MYYYRVSGFLAAKEATARSLQVTPKNTQPCLPAVSLGGWRMGTRMRNREPLPATACDRCSSKACHWLSPSRRQRTEQRYTKCLQVSPTAMSHTSLPSLTGQVPDLIVGSSRLEICCFGELKNWEAFSSGKPQQGKTSLQALRCKSEARSPGPAPVGVFPRMSLTWWASLPVPQTQHARRWEVCLLIC